MVKIVYGIASAPFAIFLVPIFMMILVHVKPTGSICSFWLGFLKPFEGYDSNGACLLADTEHERYQSSEWPLPAGLMAWSSDQMGRYPSCPNNALRHSLF